MSLEELNQIFKTQYQEWDEISYSELLRMLVALRCAELDAVIFACGKPPTDEKIGKKTLIEAGI